MESLIPVSLENILTIYEHLILYYDAKIKDAIRYKSVIWHYFEKSLVISNYVEKTLGIWHNNVKCLGILHYFSYL